MLDLFLWLPWEIQVLAGLLIVGALAFMFRVPPKWLIPIAATIAAGLGYTHAARKGWQAKERRDMRDADKLIEKARAARQKADRLPVENLRDDDGHRRD